MQAVQGKFLAAELHPENGLKKAHSPHRMAALPPKSFPELTQVSLLAGYQLHHH